MAENSAWPLGLFQKNAMAFWKNLKTRQLKQCIHFFCIEFVVHLQNRNLRLQSRKGDDMWWLYWNDESKTFCLSDDCSSYRGIIPVGPWGHGISIVIAVASPCPFGYTKNELFERHFLADWTSEIVWFEYGVQAWLSHRLKFSMGIHAPLRWAGARPPNRHRFHAWQAWMRQGARAKF